MDPFSTSQSLLAPGARRRSPVLAHLLLGAALFSAGLGFPAARTVSAQTAASVAINAGTAELALPGPGFGVNTAAWDGFLLDSQVPALLKQAGITTMRFPGGSVTDVYHWQTNTASQGQYINSNNTFDAFMGVVNQTGAQALICVNYGTNIAGNAAGDPNEAAAWVDYANNTKKYGVKYWEVGNEVYGNGEYNTAFEADLHSDHSPTAYGNNVALYVSAMKAKDPSIKVGAVLISPGHFPDGQSPDWNTNVLAQCGSVIDFVIVHYYPQEPGTESDAFLLGAPQGQISGMMTKIRSLISQYCGTRASNVQVFVTETNSVDYNPGKQTVSLVNGLFMADDYATWLEQGAANVDIWTLHNGVSNGNASGSLYGTTSYGDYGLFATGDSPEPAAETPFPSYHGIRMLSYLGKAGDQFVGVSSSQSLLGAHAVKQTGGNLALMLINRDPANSYTASVRVSGFAPASASTDYFYGQSSGTGGISSAASTAGSAFTRTVPPYSLTTVVMRPASGGARPVITSNLNPPSRQGVSFAYQITASNNPASFGESGLPAGLRINQPTGKITGAPTVHGNFVVTIAAFNSTGSGTAKMNMHVKEIVPVITSSQNASGKVGVAFNYQITATGSPKSYGTHGLPAGLGVSKSTGKIIGTPTKAGTYSVTLEATNDDSAGTAKLTLVINS